MDARTYFANDIKGVTAVNIDATLSAANKITDRYNTAGDLLASKFWASLNAQSEWAILSAFAAMADAEGRSRMGLGSLADDIMAGQASRIQEFGVRAYRLSEKQATIVIQEAFAWIFVKETA